MVPSAIVIPEIHVAVFAGVLHPAGLLGLLAALVVVVAGGLCAVIVLQGRIPARRERAASARALRVARLGGEREDAAAA